MTDEDLLHAQRQLRGRLLDTRQGVLPGAADLAAHLLLYLEDADRCWQLAAQWIRDNLDADHVDGGFAAPGAAYRPSGHSVRTDVPELAIAGLEVAAEDGALRTVWQARGAVVFDDIATDARFAARTRAQLLAAETRAKLAVAVRDGGEPVGLICCNWGSTRQRWKPDLCRQVGELSTHVLGPIFAAAARPGSAQCRAPAPMMAVGLLAELTPGELEVARLVVTGMTYKEIAARLNRSFSTVDHRLRAIREKSGARSTARMVAQLSDLLAHDRHQ